MSKERKKAFLILRLLQETKDELAQKAREAGQTVSEYVRDIIKKHLNG